MLIYGGDFYKENFFIIFVQNFFKKYDFIKRTIS